MLKIICTYVFSLFLLSCATQRAYEGEKLPDDQLATIYDSEETKFEDGKIIALIEYVGEIQVGDSVKGWPQKVQVKPGQVNMRLRIKKGSLSKKITQGVLMMGGAVGGVVAGAINTDSEGLFEVSVEVDKGKHYIIEITSPSGSIGNLEFKLREFKPRKKYKI